MAATGTRAATKSRQTTPQEDPDAIEEIEVQAEVHEPPPKEKTVKKKATPKKRAKTTRQPAPKPAEIREFMRQQAEVNDSILQQLQRLTNKDKCGQPYLNSGVGGQAIIETTNSKGNKNKARSRQVEVSSDSSSESESDNESMIRKDITEANSLLQARFNKTTGRHKSARRIERDIKSNRPFAFLEREVQRQLAKENVHPEELPMMVHLEGLVGLVSAQCVDSKTKAMLGHVHQVIKDSQVHSWCKIRKWSNETLVKTATQEWDWVEQEKIVQARNSHYIVQNLFENENVFPCPDFNKTQCSIENSHYGVMGSLVHICGFCYALEGLKEPHPAKSCGKRRSSSNYFRHKDDGSQNLKKDKGRFKGYSKDTSEERSAKN